MSTCADCGYETGYTCQPGACGFDDGDAMEAGCLRSELFDIRKDIRFAVECLDSWAKAAEEFPSSKGKAEAATYTAPGNRLRRCL